MDRLVVRRWDQGDRNGVDGMALDVRLCLASTGMDEDAAHQTDILFSSLRFNHILFDVKRVRHQRGGAGRSVAELCPSNGGVSANGTNNLTSSLIEQLAQKPKHSPARLVGI